MLQFDIIAKGSSGRSGMCTTPRRSDSAIHVLVIWARFPCISGRRMCSSGSGCRLITASASRVLGPHSFECGRKVIFLQFSQIASLG